MAKGADFERHICIQLSRWWSRGERSDIFWRTAGSGARATTRKKKGLSTKGSYGDLNAIDQSGQVLIDTVCIELKRGYHKDTISDLLDKTKRAKKQTYEAWIEKLIETTKAAKAESWFLIVRRDRRESLIYTPLPFLMRLVDAGAFHYKLDESQPFLMLRATGFPEEIAAMHLTTFFQGVSADHIYALRTKEQRHVG